MNYKTEQQFSLPGCDSIDVEVDRAFTIKVDFPSARVRVPIVTSGPCLNSLGYEMVSPQSVEYYLVGIKPGIQKLDFGLGCVADVTVIKSRSRRTRSPVRPQTHSSNECML